MHSAGFDPTNWSHWLLLGCFTALSAWGLMASWRWQAGDRTRRKWNKRMRAERNRVELTYPRDVRYQADYPPQPKIVPLPAIRNRSK